MTVLVAIPFYGRPDLLPKAVKSALRQTIKDILVVVYGDGETPPKLPKDSRLRVHVASVNRGPYFAFQAMLLASPCEYIAPLAADDWLEPDHLEQMMPAVQRYSAITTGRVWWHTPNGRTKLARVARGYGYEVGLFRVDRLLGMGGWDPSERVGQDSLLVQLLPITGGRRISGVPTYHRLRRPGSLSTSEETGNKSRYRDAVRERNSAVLKEVRSMVRRGRPLHLVRDYRTGLIPPDIKAALDTEVAALRAIL